LDRYDKQAILRRLGIEQRELAKKAGVHDSHVSRWISGQRNSERIDKAFEELTRQKKSA